MSLRLHAVFTVLATVVVTTAVAWGFVLVGSPEQRRLARFDEQRLQDLQTIAREIQSLVVDPNKTGKLKEKLPPTLADAVKMARNQRLNLRDPQTDQPYAYTVKSESTYELCATFALPCQSDYQVFWNHPAGPHCFIINTLDPPPF